MCGIVGMSGSSDAITPVIEGLSRLEYRGYDSAGISINDGSELVIYKKEGKLQNLKELLKAKSPKSHIAIGHTRWATHGKVNDTNAHPHGNKVISVVHNGIIENAYELKEKLQKQGFIFKSETDSEVFMVLLTKYTESEPDFNLAIRKAFEEIEGNSAFVIMKHDSHKLYAIKRSAPLVCGLNKTGDVFMSSDPYALVGFADQIFFPEDEVLCVGDFKDHGKEIQFFELSGKESTRYKMQEKQVSLDVVSKGNFEHFMLKEIYEQPILIQKLIDNYLSEQGLSSLEKFSQFKPSNIHLAACGTALHAGLVIKNYFEKYNKIRVLFDYASEFRYRPLVFNKDELGLFISQSGETADTLACQQLCNESGLKTYSIVNVEGSTLYRDCDENLLIHAGVEIGVASTKAFTQQVLTGFILSKAITGNIDSEAISKEFNLLSHKISELLERTDEIKSIAKHIYNYNGFIFTGRGEEFPIALEGALKLKEIAYVHAEGYAAGELKHGPISLIDEKMVNIAIVTPDLYEKTLSNAQEVKARGGLMVLIGQEGDQVLQEISDCFIGLDYSGLTDTKPILTNVVLQLLSYYIAKLKGTDIDKPRNLAKSVTVE